MKIHHAVLKRAAKVGVTLTADPAGRIWANDSETGLVLADGAEAKAVLAAAEAARLADNEPDNDEPEDDAAEGNGAEVEATEGEDDGAEGFEPTERSIIKRKYRKRYQPMNRTCGDELAKLIAAHVKEDDALNLDKLIRFAKANDCWVDAYLGLNPGQIRMNVGNRLRAKVRKGHEILWAN